MKLNHNFDNDLFTREGMPCQKAVRSISPLLTVCEVNRLLVLVNAYVVVNFLSLVIFLFLLFLGMVMHAHSVSASGHALLLTNKEENLICSTRVTLLVV